MSVFRGHTKPEQYAPDETVADQLRFALKWEGGNLAVLSARFRAAPAADIAAAIRATPSGTQTRRLWFVYEWLTGERLDLPDAGKVAAVNVLNPQQQFALPHGEISTRHRVRNNLPGTRDFCPLVRRTPALDAFAGSGLSEQVKAVAGAVHPDVMARAAAFMVLRDSRASFRIEGEKPARDRTHRWAQSIAAAGAPRGPFGLRSGRVTRGRREPMGTVGSLRWDTIGLLPYAIIEQVQRLRIDCRLWRIAPDSTVRAWIEQRIIDDAGNLGHYVADGSNPHHTTTHHHGWVGDNPNGYTTDNRFHGRFEPVFVQAHLKAGNVTANMSHALRWGRILASAHGGIDILRTQAP